MAVDKRSAPSHLVEMSADVRAAVLADPAGGPLATSEGIEGVAATEFAGLAADLFVAADRALGDPTQQVEAQVVGGSVYAVRSADHVLACGARRNALPALVLFDLQHVLAETEA